MAEKSDRYKNIKFAARKSSNEGGAPYRSAFREQIRAEIAAAITD
jgi:hypothetical protein